MTLEKGQIVITGRAFAQDAESAMKGEIIRGLVELITNSDDAYGECDGDITVEIIRNTEEPISVCVRDAATGLSLDGLKKCFGVAGAKTGLAHQGEVGRGLFGRGAKDTASFGRTRFEAIKNGSYSTFELLRDGSWTSDSAQATETNYEELCIPSGQDGLSATIFIEKAGLNVRRTPQIVEQLANHIQLRRLTEKRMVSIHEIVDGSRGPSQVAVWENPNSDHLGEYKLDLDGYPGIKATLNLHKLKTPSETIVNEYSDSGIEIRGKRTNYDNTFFGETSNETSWIRGTLDCSYIDELVLDYEKTQGNDPLNPTQIISRDRDGIDLEHPFIKAMTSAVLLILNPILEELKPAQDESGGSTELRQDLSKLGKDLSKLLKADLDDIEDDDESRGGTSPTHANPLILIPPYIKMPLGGKRSISLLSQDSSFSEGLSLAVEKVSTTPSGIVEVRSVSHTVPHSIYDGISNTIIRIESLQLGVTTLTVTDHQTGFSTSAEIHVHEPNPQEEEPPETLEWKNASMSVTVEKTRSLLLKAPIELAPGGQLPCRISLDGDGCALEDDVIELVQTDKGWLEGRCRIRGLVANQKCTITAHGAGTDAIGTIKVSIPSGIGGLGTEIKILDQSHGKSRGRVQSTDTGYLIEIYGRHPGLDKLLGRKKADGSFQNEKEHHTRIALSEALASVIADWLLGKEANKYPQDFTDVDSMLAHRNKNTARYLPIIQQLLS